MPMIIKNGRKYCTSSTLADDVIYDNTNSGLQAGTVGDAIDELNSKSIFYRGGITSNLTLTDDETVVPYKQIYSNHENLFIDNSDGTLTYNGEKDAILIVNAYCYFFTGTTNKLFYIKITKNSSAYGQSNNYVASQYVTYSCNCLMKVTKGDIIKVTVDGGNGDVIQSNNIINKLIIYGEFI